MERKVLQLIGRELKRKKCVASRMSTKTTVLRKKHKNFTIVIGSSELGGRCCELLAQVGTSQPRDTLLCQTRKRPCEVHILQYQEGGWPLGSHEKCNWIVELLHRLART